MKEKFEKAGIPFDELDPEMVEILDVLNFDLGIKTKFCCFGHAKREPTYIMFDDDMSDEQAYSLLEVVDSNVGTSGVKYTKLFKWARTFYHPITRDSFEPKMNWMLEIGYVKHELKQERLNAIVFALRNLKCQE